MGAEGAANVIFRRQIAGAEDPKAMRARMVKEYKSELMHPYYAAERGLVDDVIDPAETREVLIKSLAMLHTKHADLPSRQARQPAAVTRGATSMSTPDIRVGKGHAEPEEVAAITALLLARAAARPAEIPPTPTAAAEPARAAPPGARAGFPGAAQLALTSATGEAPSAQEGGLYA
ncbi:hypothetical protein SANTM175S_06108 [Streptomyces antimycoticus]